MTRRAVLDAEMELARHLGVRRRLLTAWSRVGVPASGPGGRRPRLRRAIDESAARIHLSECLLAEAIAVEARSGLAVDRGRSAPVEAESDATWLTVIAQDALRSLSRRGVGPRSRVIDAPKRL